MALPIVILLLVELAEINRIGAGRDKEIESPHLKETSNTVPGT